MLINAHIVTIAHMAQTMIRRIPVSDARWKQLGKLKQAGQTYDDLIADMVVAYNRSQLADAAKRARSGKGNWHNIEDA
jgi:hypothetical protein